MKRCYLLVIGLLALLASGGQARAEDAALVIGINEYPGLSKGANLSECVRDAQRMENLLKGYGFTVTTLTDKKASRKEIEATLDKISKKLDKKSRFVCYYAGYGVTNTKDGVKESALLPSDARDDKTDKDLPLLALHKKVDSLPAAVKTMIMDTCFSPAMVREGGAGGGGLRPRAYLRNAQKSDKTRAWQLIDPNNADTAEPQIANGSTAYFAASLRTQTAYEHPGQGGVFTSALASALERKPGRWQEVQSGVSNKVAGTTKGEQTPLLLPIKYLGQGVFSVATSAPAPDQSSLADIYSLSRPSVFQISLKMEPRRSPLPVATRVRFRLTLGNEGYLLLVGRDPKNQIGLVWPNSSDIEAARVEKGTVYVPGQEQAAFQADTPGTDALKAFLFPPSAKDAAALMLKYLREGMDADAARARLQEIKVKPGEFFTSEIITQITAPPPGR